MKTQNFKVLFVQAKNKVKQIFIVELLSAQPYNYKLLQPNKKSGSFIVFTAQNNYYEKVTYDAVVNFGSLCAARSV